MQTLYTADMTAKRKKPRDVSLQSEKREFRIDKIHWNKISVRTCSSCQVAFVLVQI